MKNNPKRHKAQNTFRFQTFSERISNIDIDVFHKVKHPYEEDDEVQSSHFAHCLTKWNTENFAPDFIELKKNLPFDISLPQLLLRKDEIAGVLIAHLRNCDIDSLQPALELIVAAAKDLRKEFYPYFCPSILRECVNLLNTREPEQIEWIFTCLAHLFKYLWAPIIRNINFVLLELLPLLSNNSPQYIINFASESFAYVARKVRHKAQFVSLCLKNIKNNEETLSGIARLYFEVVKNVGDQFYSGAEEFIVVLLEELNNRKWSALVYAICESFVSNLISFVTVKTDVSVLWKSFMTVAKQFQSVWLEQNDSESGEKLTMILKLVKQFLKSSEILRNPEDLLNFILKLAVDPNIVKFFDLHSTVVDIISELLVNKNFSTKLTNCEDVIVKVFRNIKDERLAIHFAERIITVLEYESLAFREVLKFVEIHTLSDNLIEFLAKLIWMKTGFRFGKDEKLAFYSAGFESSADSLKRTIISKISVPFTYEVAESILQVVLIACNIENCRPVITKKVDLVLRDLCEQLNICVDVERVAKLLYILLMVVQSRIHFNKRTSLNYITLVKLAVKYADSSNYLCSLRILDLVSSLRGEHLDNCQSIQSVFELLNTSHVQTMLIDNLCSPFHKVRLFTLNVLMKLDIHPIFESLYAIETIVPSVQSYRDKLHKLQQFDFTEKFNNEVESELLRTAVLKFLVGNLYINFQYMWEPVQKLITSHLDGDENAWTVFEHQLLNAVADDIDSVKLMKDFRVDFQCEFLREHFYELNGVDDRPDFYNFRCLLIGVLTKCKNVGFKNEHFIPDLFLKFYKTEYATNVYDFKSSCNIRRLCENDEQASTANESRVDLEDEKNEPKNVKNLNKLFVTLLKLINAISHRIPNKYREELYNIHLEILSNGNSDVQQAAVNYITKNRKMSHYKDRLLSLIKESSFKNELLNIRIDFNSDALPERDRGHLMKIILRILYEKVRKKSTAHLRDCVFEFLAGCNDGYMIKFFDMFFKQFNSYVQSSTNPLLFVDDEIHLESVLPPSCLLTYANTVMDLQKRCGKLLNHSCLSYLLKVLFKVAATIVVLLNAKTSVYPGYYGILSKIRIVSFEAIVFFVENFDYEWSENEIRAVVQYFIEPWISKVVHECLQSPNPVMKLFVAFSKNPRYYPLLAHKCDDLTPLDALMSLLNSDKVYFNVKNSVLEVVERLLMLEQQNEENVPIVSDLMYMDNSFSHQIKENRQYGTLLLLPHVSTILVYLEKSLSRRYIKLNGIYMLILKRVSEMGLHEEASATLLNLLMPVLKSKVTADEDVVTPLLDTIYNLFKRLDNGDLFEEYILQIAYLFGIATASPVRRILRDIVMYIGEKTGMKYVNANLVYGLNVFDPRFVDQPDYAGRLEAYTRVNEASVKGELNLYTGIFVIYNAFYMLKNERDMALRDHSGLCLRRICPVLARKYEKSSKEFAVLLNDTLLPLIRDGIRDVNENYQSESVILLGHMVRECPTLHPVFKNLYVLTDASDLDNDFFENIQHLQMHRRTKALKRFAEVMSQEMKPPQPYSLTFVLPLVSRYLLRDKTANETALIHASIEALKVICRLSSWLHYERILRQYVMEMRKNVALRKQAIRIISVILDAFHFDISAAGDDVNCDAKKSSNGTRSIEEPMNVDGTKDESTKTLSLQPAVKRLTVLGRSDAVRVYKSIRAFLVPSLDRIFMKYEESDQCHKLSKKGVGSDKEEMAVLSIPIAFAEVKLLKRLPAALLEQYIPNIFLKLSTYLKSRLMSIRLVARETMQNILMEIGPSYFPELLSEMMSILTKGFQIHVLVFTCHAILEKIQSLFTDGHMDACVDPVLEICIVDLFGKLAEEKEVVQISSKTPEAKGNKSYNMLSIVAEYISENRILDLVLPLKEILSSNMSSKIVGKVSKCLKYIALGLTRNRFLNAQSLLEFAYGVSHDCIPALVAERENNKVKIENAKPVEKSDCYVIPEEPRHLTTEKRKICSRTNSHVIIEFGLELLASMLKREIVRSANYRPHLDPFIPLITDCLQSQYNKLVVLSLKCSIYLLRRDLQSLKDNTSTICESVFVILSKYSSATVSGENGELVMSAAKVALVLVRDLKHPIDDDQLRILLYVVEDLQKTNSHYGTGFALLKAILIRKYSSADVHELMRKTGELSIIAYSDRVRYMARKAYYYYLVNYPHNKKKLRDKVEFIAAQLMYEEIAGRKSAIEMLTVIANAFPKEELLNLCSLLFVKLASRLIEDDCTECKKMAFDCIAAIIKRIRNTKEEGDLFDATINWLNEKKVQCRSLAIQLLGIFVAEKREKFASKLDDILPAVENQLYSGRANGVGKHVKAPAFNEVAEDSKNENDALVFHVLQLYKCLMEMCPSLLFEGKYQSYVQRVADNCQLLLKHSHEWVRLGAAQVLGLIFKSLDIGQVTAVVSKRNKAKEVGFLLDRQARKQIKRLCQDFCDQLVPGHEIMEQLLKQSMRNLLFLAEVLQNIPCSGVNELSLPWLVSKLVNKVRKEVAHAPRMYTVRTMVFNWLAALAVKFDEDKLIPSLHIAFTPILRELSTTDEQGVVIRRAAKEALKLYRKKVNSDMYDKTMINVQRKLDTKRAQRKMKITQMPVMNPERAARRKMRIREKKKEMRKRRLERLRKRKFKSRKPKLVEITD